MRINGRTLRYSTLAERRLFLAAGLDRLRVPRSENPYSVARRLARAAREQQAALSTAAGFQRDHSAPPAYGPEADHAGPLES